MKNPEYPKNRPLFIGTTAAGVAVTAYERHSADDVETMAAMVYATGGKLDPVVGQVFFIRRAMSARAMACAVEPTAGLEYLLRQAEMGIAMARAVIQPGSWLNDALTAIQRASVYVPGEPWPGTEELDDRRLGR